MRLLIDTTNKKILLHNMVVSGLDENRDIITVPEGVITVTTEMSEFGFPVTTYSPATVTQAQINASKAADLVAEAKDLLAGSDFWGLVDYRASRPTAEVTAMDAYRNQLRAVVAGSLNAIPDAPNFDNNGGETGIGVISRPSGGSIVMA